MSDARYCKQWRVQTARNGKLRVPCEPAAARILDWLAQDYSLRQIAAATHCNRRTIGDIASGRHTTCHRSTVHKILTATLGTSNIPDHQPVDATGTRRRLQALIAIGHSPISIARELAHSPGALSKVVNGHYPMVRQTTAKAVAALYREWSARPGRCVRSRNRAIADGWHGPLAWNNIDDPAEIPEPEDIAEATNRNELALACRQEVLHLARYGTPTHEIAVRVDRSETTVRELLRKTNPALLNAISA